jgi:hypothetical protein
MSSCFGTDKNENLKLFACDPDGDLKSCCSPGDSCASNGLCVSPNDDALTPYFINGCTDENWDDPTCLKQCDGTFVDSREWVMHEGIATRFGWGR